MMTKFKFYLLSILAVISLTTLTSCETDEDIGYSLAGAFGKIWYGDFGSSEYGTPLDSEIMFMAGRYDNAGTGWERTYYQYDGTPCYSDTFDWEIVNGVLYLYFAHQGERRIYNYYIDSNVFSGYQGDSDSPFELRYGLAGAFGKTWYGDFGSSDAYGEPLYSEIMIMAGRSDNAGTGWERTYYQYDGVLCYSDTFDWEIVNGVLYLYSAHQNERRIYDYSVGYRVFKGYRDNFPFELYLDRRW